MLTVTVCPACGESIDLAAAGEHCPYCGAPLPEQLRSAAQAALTRRRPILITVLMIFFVILAAFWFLMITISVVTDAGTYTVGTERVTRDQFVARFAPVLMVFGSLLLATSYAFWKERPWGRHLMIAYLVLVSVYTFVLMPGQFSSDFSLAMTILPIAFLLWYFCAKPNVVSYYRQLKDRRLRAPGRASG